MTRNEINVILTRAFGLEDVLDRFEAMHPLDALRESIKYWDWAKAMQDSGPGAGWAKYENEKTLAYVLMGMYCWRLGGHEEYPALPDAGADVMADSHAHLCLWSRSLILDHVHRWTSRGGSPVCRICGEERFDPEPMVRRARNMLKERGG